MLSVYCIYSSIRFKQTLKISMSFVYLILNYNNIYPWTGKMNGLIN